MSEVQQSEKKITIDNKNAWQRYVSGERSMACVVVVYVIQSYYNWIQKYTQQTAYKKTSKIGLRNISPSYMLSLLWHN